MQHSESSGSEREPPIPQESEQDFWENDSALGGVQSYASSLTSLTPSLYQHVEEHGRTYHAYKSGKYMLPNDEKEQDRLDLQHSIFLQCLGGRLALAPIDKIALHNVLDIATGTGLWAIEFADQHPEAHVTGTDLSPIQPTYVPTNCTFEVDDAEDEWLFSHSFEYIHARAILSCFANPKEVIQSAFNALAPGGYLEFQDPVAPSKFGIPPPADSAFLRWNELSMRASVIGGRPWNNGIYYAQWMREVGFEDVHEETFFLPLGPWVDGDDEKAMGLRKLGLWQKENVLQGLEGMTVKNLSRVKWEPEESKVLVAQVREELTAIVPGGPVRPYVDMKCVWGRKPFPKEETDEVHGTA